MVNSAYTFHPIQKDFAVRIESVAIWEDLLLVCTIDGSLRIFTRADKAPGRHEYALSGIKTGFRKRAVTQIFVLTSRSVLLTLADVIAVHSLPLLEQISIIPRSHGANAFAISEDGKMIAFSVKKKIVFFRIVEMNDFGDCKEVGLPDPVNGMAWCGNRVLVGLANRKEYWMVDPMTGSAEEASSCGRSASPLLMSLPEGEVLLGKDNLSVFVSSSGTIRSGDSIRWSEPPASIVYHHPYVIAKLSKFIEVRTMRSGHTLVQTLPLNKVQVLAAGSDVLVAATERGMYAICPRPIREQVEEVSMASDYENALFLSDILPNDVKRGVQNGIRIRYGYHFFEDGDYVSAMEQFQLSNHHPAAVLKLYPCIQLPQLSDELAKVVTHHSTVLEEPEIENDLIGGELVKAIAALVGYLSNWRVTAVQEVFCDGSETSTAGSPTPRISSDCRRALSVIDTALLQSLLILDVGLPLESPSLKQSETLPVSASMKSVAFQQLLKSVKEIMPEIEGATSASSLILFLRSPNFCDVDICELKLLKFRKVPEVVELYRSQGIHKKALSLLRSEGTPEDTVQYLKGLVSSSPSLVLEHSGWVLQERPELGIELFTGPHHEAMSSTEVLDHLKTYAPQMRTTYLEHLLGTVGNMGASANLHDELVQLHLDRVMEERTVEASGNVPWEESHFTPSRMKFFSTLQKSNSFNPIDVLSVLPKDAFHSERALLLGKLNCHVAVLALLARKIGSLMKCLAYCEMVSTVDLNVYEKLLEVFLDPEKSILEYNSAMADLLATAASKGPSSVNPEGSGSNIWRLKEDVMLAEAISLITVAWDKMDATLVLKMLPCQTLLQDLMPYLDPLMRTVIETDRNSAVVKSLRRSENLRVHEKLAALKGHRVLVTVDRECHICQKKISNSVFAVYPDHSVAHFVCHQKVRLANHVPAQ